MDKFDVCIAGAGVVGLAIAYQFACSPRYKNKSIVVLEQESGFGQHASSRNSEVIHAGIYYPEGSLKASLCVRGKELLYEHCRRYDIPHRRLGKLIVAQAGEESGLEALQSGAEANGVDDLRLIGQSALRVREPALSAACALLSPSTGIIDSHAFMQSLLHLAEQAGVQFAPYTCVRSVSTSSQGFVVDTRISVGVGVGAGAGAEDYRFHSETFINCAGLEAQRLAARIDGVRAGSIPELHLCKGDYFIYRGSNPFSQLIYPLPETNTQGLGIHSTVDLGGRLRFGPDSQYVDTPDYQVDGGKATRFADAVKCYFPGVEVARLAPAYSGIRPKLAAEGEAAADFRIQAGDEHGVAGLIQLFGIESPGLTAGLAIGEYVCGLLEA